MKKLNSHFIEKATKVHGDVFIYDKVNYTKAKTKVTITCKTHGDFEQTPDSHLRGRGCPNCKGLKISNTKNFSKEEFVSKANFVHRNKYDYSLLDYKNTRSKGAIICKAHGVFYQELNSHLRGAGCKACQKELLSKIKSNKPITWSYSTWEENSKISKEYSGYKVYVVKCWDEVEEFYKIGKTFRNIKKRFESKSQMPYSWKIIEVFNFDSPKEASIKEEKLHKLNKTSRYKPIKSFCGRNECYKEVVTNQPDHKMELVTVSRFVDWEIKKETIWETTKKEEEE